MSEIVLNIAPTKVVNLVLQKVDDEPCRIAVTLFHAAEKFAAMEPRRSEPDFWMTVAKEIKSWSDCDCCEISEQQAFDIWEGISQLQAADRDERKKKALTLAPSPTGTEASTAATGTPESEPPG